MPTPMTTDMVSSKHKDLMDAAFARKSNNGTETATTESKDENGSDSSAAMDTEQPPPSTTTAAAAAADNMDVSITNNDTTEAAVTATSNGDNKDPEQQLIKKKKKSKRRKRKHSSKVLFSDSICITIPLHVTADMKRPMERMRIKRIRRIFEKFPTLLEEQTKREQAVADAEAAANKPSNGGPNKNGEDNTLLDDADNQQPDGATGEGGTASAAKKPAAKQKKKTILPNVPQPKQFGSVLDYLEAKYVRGVMLGDDEDGIGGDAEDGDSVRAGGRLPGDDDGDGSVYSQTSFLDDTDLQRNVAEQVMANATLTKLELEHEDGDFFVNVGNLEVDNEEYVRDDYDPLQDKQDDDPKKKKKRVTKKKPPPADASAAATTKASADGKTGKVTSDAATSKVKRKGSLGAESTKSAKSQTSNPPTADDVIPDPVKMQEEKEAIAREQAARAKSDELHEALIDRIKSLNDIELPRLQSKLKASIRCPPNKSPGDIVIFLNPHDLSQKLRAKVPKTCVPGQNFKVTVPGVQTTPIKSGSDHNKFPRDFQEMLDDYARAYDDWCSVRGAVEKNFAILKQKQRKYDKIIPAFPPNMLTTVDLAYMKRLIRRARQNRHKRSKTASVRQMDTPPSLPENVPSSGIGNGDDDGKENQDDNTGQAKEQKEATPSTRVIHFPSKGTVFPKMFVSKDINRGLDASIKSDESDESLERHDLSNLIPLHLQIKTRKEIQEALEETRKKQAAAAQQKEVTLLFPTKGRHFAKTKFVETEFMSRFGDSE